MKKQFFITASIPYVNAIPHIGHAQEFCQVDVIARYHRLIGEDVKALCGADENALKNVQAAEKAGIDIQDFVDQNNACFLNLTKKLNVHFDIWQRGSDQVHHFISSQKLWMLCKKNNDIYKKSYKGLYCVGCETFYTLDELDEQGECLEHPGKKLDKVEETNYFFRLSRYQKTLLDLIESGKFKIFPEFRKKEIITFLKNGLNDLSISRSNERAKNWGVPVPGDPTQRIYVWFDALNIYQSGIGFGWDEAQYAKWWPVDFHVIGKGIIRFHAVYWPAFLLSAKLALPKGLFVHGYINIDGKKMSKTLGNVIDPISLIDLFGTDAVRYYLLREIPSSSDGDYSERRFKEVYNADLANGLGNLVSRIARLCENVQITVTLTKEEKFYPEVVESIEKFQFDQTLFAIWRKITQYNQTIDQEKPWEDTENKKTFLTKIVENIREIAYNLRPFLPDTAKKIEQQFQGPQVKLQVPLFPRL